MIITLRTVALSYAITLFVIACLGAYISFKSFEIWNTFRLFILGTDIYKILKPSFVRAVVVHNSSCFLCNFSVGNKTTILFTFLPQHIVV